MKKEELLKNIGKTFNFDGNPRSQFLKVKNIASKNDLKYEAKLVNANSNQISLFWKRREKKPIGKGKITVEKKIDLLYKDIVEAKVKIKL